MIKYKFTEKKNSNNVIWVEAESESKAIDVFHKLISVKPEDILKKYKIEAE